MRRVRLASNASLTTVAGSSPDASPREGARRRQLAKLVSRKRQRQTTQPVPPPAPAFSAGLLTIELAKTYLAQAYLAHKVACV